MPKDEDQLSLSFEGIAPGPASPRFILLDAKGNELDTSPVIEDAMSTMRKRRDVHEVRNLDGILMGRRARRGEGLPKITSTVYSTPSVWFGSRKTAC